MIFAVLLLIVMAVPVGAQTLRDGIAQGDRSFRAGDFAAAVRKFSDTARRFPGEPIPRLARGHALFALGKYAEASRSLQQGIRIFPLWSRSGINLPGFFHEPGLFIRNMKELAQRIDTAPHDTDLLFLRAYCLHFSGRIDDGQALFKRLLEMTPDHEAARTFTGVGATKPRAIWPGGRGI